MEQRAYRRFFVELPARYRTCGSHATPFEVTILDVGPEGMCFLSKTKVDLGQKIEFHVDLDPKDKIFLKAEVMWVKELDKAYYKAGVKIVDANAHDEERFIKFYCQQLLVASQTSRKILVIEDDRDLAEVLRTQLERANYSVVCAYDGEDGLHQYSQAHPDLILLDLNLPKLSGSEICRRIRRGQNDDTTPIIIITGQDGETDRIIGRVLGAEKYMIKPFSMAQLLHEISELLEKPHPAKKS